MESCARRNEPSVFLNLPGVKAIDMLSFPVYQSAFVKPSFQTLAPLSGSAKRSAPVIACLSSELLTWVYDTQGAPENWNFEGIRKFMFNWPNPNLTVQCPHNRLVILIKTDRGPLEKQLSPFLTNQRRLATLSIFLVQFEVAHFGR